MNNEDSNQQVQNSNVHKTDNDSKVPGKIVFGLLGLLFLPAVILGTLMYWLLLRTFRQKTSVVFFISLVIGLISVLVWKLTNASEKIVNVIQNWRNIDVYWTDLIPAFISVNLFLGTIFGFFLIYLSIRQMKNNPHRTQLEGTWMYKFKFRRTPLEYYKRIKKIKGLKEGKYHSADRIPLGIDEDDNIEYRYNTEMHQSTLLSGTTGSGKTITMLNSMLSDIVNGISIVVIDFKRSAEFSSKLARWASDNDSNFYHFVNGKPERYPIMDSPGQAYYDPIKNAGNAKADMILGMREYDTSAAVYKQGMRELLQTLLLVMKHVDKNKTKNIKWDEGEIYKINSIVNGLNGSAIGNLSELVDATSGTEAETVARDLELKVKNKTSSLHNAFLALQGQMSTLVNSDYGRWLKYEKNGRNIDLYKLLKEPKNVILFSMDGLSEKDFAKYMGSLILSDLSAVSAMRLRNDVKDHVNVYIDEFQAVSPSSLAPLLEKSRASGFGTTMASQSYEQIISAAESNGEAQLNGILDTCANFIVHAGATEKSARRLSEIAGEETKTVYRQANQNEGFLFSFNWKNRRNQMVHTSTETDWIAPPRKFMNLSMPKPSNDYKTEAIIVKKSSDDPMNKGKDGVVIKKLWMIPNNKVLESYYSQTEGEDDAIADISEEEQARDELENFIAEREFDLPEAPLDYLGSEEETFTQIDELDNLDESQLEEDDEIVDGDFNYEILEDDEDPADELLKNINLDSVKPINKDSHLKVKNENRETVQKTLRTKKQSEVSKGIPTRSTPDTANSSHGLPLTPNVAEKKTEKSYGNMLNSDNFKPTKRRKERPPVVDDEEELDDALPDFNF